VVRREWPQNNDERQTTELEMRSMTASLAVRPKAATYADLKALPPDLVGEILYGTLVTHPQPVPRHGAATGSVAGIVYGPFQFGINGPGGWTFIIEPELHLGEHVVVPDLAGWRRERLSSDAADKAWMEIAPDWVLETLSPSTEKYDRGDKRRIYAEFAVSHLWLLDPRVRCLETFSLQTGHWQVDGTWFDTDEVRAEPFAQISFSLGLLWPFDQLSVPAPNPETN
jgi:Uma2 family endonuclease